MDKMLLGIKLGETLKMVVKRLSTEFPKIGGITLEQFVLLNILNKNEDLIQQDLANLMSRDKSGVLRLIDALEEKKMVVRVTDKLDRRKKNLILTKKGAEVVNRCLDKEAEIFEEFLEGIDEPSLAVFSDVLSKIQNNSKCHSYHSQQ
jgi:DNA-binding MarR family transcriptional regulator